MDVIAHRGFAEAGVENALSTLVAAEGDADAVEFDVRAAADGVPVVFHDETVDRLTDATGAVTDFTAEELASLTLVGIDETIPRLSTVLDRLSGPIVPELKTRDGIERTVELLAGYDGPVLVSSFAPAALRALSDDFDRALLVAPPDGGHGPWLPEGAVTSISEAMALARELGCAAVHPHHSLCSTDAVADLQADGLAVNAWTIRSRETAEQVREAGVDGAIADSPAYVSEG